MGSPKPWVAQDHGFQQIRDESLAAVLRQERMSIPDPSNPVSGSVCSRVQASLPSPRTLLQRALHCREALLLQLFRPWILPPPCLSSCLVVSRYQELLLYSESGLLPSLPAILSGLTTADKDVDNAALAESPLDPPHLPRCLDSLFACPSLCSCHAGRHSGPVESAEFVTRVPRLHCSHTGSSRNLCDFTRIS